MRPFSMIQSNDYNLYLYITSLLQIIRIPAHTLGYHYLFDALILIIKSGNTNFSVTKDIYPIIAQNNHTTFTLVEHSIRQAIHSAYHNRSTPLTAALFAHKRPTNSEFLTTLVNYIYTKCAQKRCSH